MYYRSFSRRDPRHRRYRIAKRIDWWKSVLNIHDFSSHSSNRRGRRSEQRDRLKVRFWIAQWVRTATSRPLSRSRVKDFEVSRRRQPVGKRERTGSGSPRWNRFPWRQSPRPSASARSRTFVSRSNPPLSLVPAFPGDLRDRIPGLADGFQCRQEDCVSCSAKCVIIRACTNCSRVSVMQFRSSAACTCGLNNERPPYIHEALVCVHKGLRIRGFSKRTVKQEETKLHGELSEWLSGVFTLVKLVSALAHATPHKTRRHYTGHRELTGREGK